MSAGIVEEELDIDYHRQKYAAVIAAVNTKTATYFTHQALQSHSLVVKNALNDAQTSAVMIAQKLSEQARLAANFSSTLRGEGFPDQSEKFLIADSNSLQGPQKIPCSDA
jgi:hypothetical protein